MSTVRNQPMVHNLDTSKAAALPAVADDVKGMLAQAGVPRGVLLPASMGEAMEFAKLMSMTKSVPPHLRNNPGDCLAVVMQSMRWGADPYAVASKSYFVNDRIAYEAQLIMAVIYAFAPIQERLEFFYQQDQRGALECRVRAKFKGEDNYKEVWQSSSTITVKNSPLWKQAEKQQLGYYTARLWARLYCPDIILGIYAADELPDAPPPMKNVTPRPTRDDFKGDAETGNITVITSEPETAGETQASSAPTAEEEFEQNTLTAATSAAEHGTEAYMAFYKAATIPMRAILKPRAAEFKAICEMADQAASQGASISHGDELENDDPFTGASANDESRSAAHSQDSPQSGQAQEEPQDQQVSDSPPSDAGSAAGKDDDGQPSMFAGGEQLSSLERFIKVMDSLASTGAIDAEIRKHGAWYDTLDDEEKMHVDNAVDRARERARKREKKW